MDAAWASATVVRRRCKPVACAICVTGPLTTRKATKCRVASAPPSAMLPSTFKEPLMTYPTYLTDEQAEAFGCDLDALRDEVQASLGADDAAYIRRIINLQRSLDLSGRALLFAGVLPPCWLSGTALLSVAKILENMEIGHNVMHGQWDWLHDPTIHSSTWEWDSVCPSALWKHSHNVVHHRWTNVLGMDRDLGYGPLRVSDQQTWHPAHLVQPISNALLALLFEWGVALHDVRFSRIRRGEVTRDEARAQLDRIARKAARQLMKDY